MFEDKTIAITGAGSGIGRALAQGLAARGAKLALADKDAAGLDATIAQLGNAHTSRHVVDVGDRDAVYAFAEATAATFGTVDGVINNAGVAVVGTMADTSDADFQWLMDINFWGVVHGTRAFLPLVRQAETGWIVNVSSVFGLIGYPGQSAYNASKFAVRGFTEALRHELAALAPHVRVVCVHPGGIKTQIARNARFHPNRLSGLSREQAVDQFDQSTPTTPDQAAATILRGMERGRPRVLIGPDARLIDTVQRLMPAGYLTLLGRLLGWARARDQAGESAKTPSTDAK